MKNLSQFINSANTPQNTGGGTSHSSTVVTPVWKGSRPTVSRRSTDSQPKEHRTHTLLCKALKYAAMILLTLTLGVGNVWGGTITWNTADNSGSSDVTLTANHTFTGDDASTILTYANPNGCKRIKSSGGLYMNGASQYNSSKNQRHFTFKAPSVAGTVSITFAAINGKNDGTGSTTVRIYGGTTVAYDVNTLNSSLTSPVIEGLKTGTSDVIITFLAKCTIKEIKWTDVASTTYTTVYANDFTASPMGAAAVSYSSMSAMASAVTGWTGWDNTYAKGYASSSSSCSATLTFATPLALNSDGTDCGRIRVYWGHSSNNKTLGLKVNGSSVTFSPTTVATTIYPKMLNVAEYTIPKATTSISSIQPSGSSSTVTYLFRIEVLTHSSCSAPTSPTITATPASAAYTEGDNISLTASATGTGGSTTYTWYKGADWATASAGSSIGSAATYTKNSCVEGDAGTYWCNISNGTGCEVQVSKIITVAAAAKAYTVTAASNNDSYGTAEATASALDEDETTAVTATAEDGYKFVSWAVSGTGASLSSTTDNPTTLTMGTANATVTANFRELYTYTMSYAKGSAEGVTGSKDSETKTEDAAFTLPDEAVFEREGYIQSGWATSDGGSKDYELGGSYTTNSAQAFYPVWTELKKVVYHANGGSGTMSPTQGLGETKLSDNTYTKTGYVFAGWATSQVNANAGTFAYTDGANVTLSSEDIDLYAVWYTPLYSFVPSGTISDSELPAETVLETSTGGTMTITVAPMKYQTAGLMFAYKSGNKGKVKIDLENALSEGAVIIANLINPDASKARGVTMYKEDGSTSVVTWTATSTDPYTKVLTITKDHALEGETSFQLERKENSYLRSLYVAKFLAPLDAITGLDVDGEATTSTSLTFEWDAVTNASSYDVYLYEDEECETLVGSKANVTTTSKEFTGLTPNTDYWCKVQAISDGVSYANGPLSDYRNGKTDEAPSCGDVTAPTSLLVGATTADGVSFTIIDDASTLNYEFYVSESSTTPESSAIATHTSTEKTKEVTGLTSGTTYYAWVRSVCDADHKSTWTAANKSFKVRTNPTASFANANYFIGASAIDVSANFSSNSEAAVVYELKESYPNVTLSGSSFSATAAGEYVVVANQAGNSDYMPISKEATVEVLESEVSDTYIWKKDAGYTGCVANPNADAPAALYTDITYEGFTGMGRAGADNTECILTFSIKNAYKSLFGIKDICTYGKFEEPLGGQISWDGGTNWEDLAAYSEGKKVFEAPGTFPTSFKIKFMGVSKSSGGLWWRNALVTLEAKKAIVSTVIDLTDVKINSTSISAANLATLKTGPAYALNLADEYVTAPTVKFNKHTVITYDDDSEVEKDDVITETAAVNLGGKWEASAEIDAITYTVTMAKADAFVVHYYQSDGGTLIGSENVAVSGHPTAAGITPTPQDYKRVVWTLSGEPVDLDDVTSAVAGTEITLVASYVDAYASSINIEQWVLDNKVANKAGFIAELEGKGYKQVDLNALDSLNDDPSKANRNYAFLGMKVNQTTSAISFLLKAGSTVKARFGNMGSSVNVTIGEAEPVALTSGDYANTSVSSAKEYSYTAEADVIVKFQSTGTSTVVFKQIMIDEAIETVILPAVVTYDANGGTFGKASEKYTGTPLVIGDATPADEDYEFEGWHVGSVEGEKINAAAYEPTANVTLVAKYVAKPSPFSLSALTFTIGAGEAQEVGYVEGTYEYDVELPYAGSYETITVAYTLAEGTSSVKAGAVLDVTSVPGAATFTIVAANTTEKTYTVNFKKAAKDGLEIIGAAVTGNTTATVTGLYKGTASVKLSDLKIDKGDYYIYVTLKEGQTLQNGDVLVVDVNAKSDIGTKALEICTGTGNLDNGILTSVAVDDYSTGENSIVLASVPAGATSIGLKRSDNLNAKINGLKVYRPMNPVLKSITFDGTKIEVAGTTVEETLPYATDLTAVTAEYYWNGAGTAVVTTNAGAWAWGDNTYVLTDKDGDATTYTITLTRATRSSDKSLSSLTVDGNAIALEDGVYDYIYEYPYGTDPATVPAVAAEANDAHASVGTITQAGSTAGTASFTVTAEDETEQEYTVSFKISRVPGLVIYDGSTDMNFVAESSSQLVTWTSADTDGTKQNANFTINGKNYIHNAKVFGGATKASRYLEFVIPENYLAKIYLAASSNSGTEATIYVTKNELGTTEKALVSVTGDNTHPNWAESDFVFPGHYFLNATNSTRLYELSVKLYPIDYTRETTPGRIGTICLEKGGVMRGAAVYEVAYFNPDNQKIYFDEVLNGEMVPGMPYVFLPDEGNNNQLVVMYGNNAAAAEAGHQNGLYGSFSREELTPNNGNYIFSENKYWFVNSDEIYVGKNRAYLKVEEIYGYEGEPEPAPAVGRRRVSMGAGAQAPNTTTGFDQITNDQSPITNKVLINGQLFILRGQKLYDATGRMVK